MLSSKTKRNISRIIPFGLIWFIFSIVYSQLEKGLLGDLTYYPSTGNPYNYNFSFFVTPVLALLTGLFIGTIEILYVNKLLIRKSFTKKIIYKSAIYFALILSFVVFLSAIGNSYQLQASFFSKDVWDRVWAFLFHYSFLTVSIYMAVVIVLSQFYTEVSENIGQEALTNFFTGKYHKPIEEERIYMFLDMRSSTTIAEKLGHIRYFELLKEYYSDLSESIIKYAGEVYQYVGDEIVITWKVKKGILNNNCIQCFFAMKVAIQKQGGKYHERFGLLPEFKAGFHVGKVTTGEIGVIKKEILFTGDVLNTTARIQGLCNSYNVDILISAPLVKQLRPGSGFEFKTLGENELRGRDEKIELFTINVTSFYKNLHLADWPGP